MKMERHGRHDALADSDLPPVNLSGLRSLFSAGRSPFYASLESRGNFPRCGSISAPNNDEFKHGGLRRAVRRATHDVARSVGLTRLVDEVIKR